MSGRGRPITNLSVASVRRRAQQRIYRAANPQTSECPKCGATKSLYAKHCRECSKIVRRETLKDTLAAKYMRRKMRAYRSRVWGSERLNDLRTRPVEVELCSGHLCMYAGYEHHHCECGLPLAPSENVCPLCI